MTEIIDEGIGRPSKRWPLALVAFVVGSAVALWLVQRSRGTDPVELNSAPSAASEADAGGV